ncbi:MAG: hypothetical protein IT349_11150 [Candidatus Eisenbacteria bacterium]|nr:hypothetical protein [Candidatus Eisenbacteria bacterium]
MTSTLPIPRNDATLAGELIAAAIVGAIFLLLLGLAELWRRALSPPAEWTRKFVHMSSGVLAGFFPWIFRTHWTLLVLGTAMVTIFTVGRRRGWFRAVLGVERSSSGERWFPVGVYLLNVIAREQPVFYLISLSALVVSDALAALLGTRYGEHHFPVGGGRKSFEGSAVFLLTTFLGVHLPLLLLTDLGRTECVVIALQLALITTAFEAIAQHGNDNLIVPLATYYLLVKMTAHDAHWIVLQLAAQLGMLVFMLLLARGNRFLSFAGALAAHLVLYAAWSLGGPRWTLAPALTLAGYLAVVMAHLRGSEPPAGGHQVQGVFYVSVVAVLLLFLDNSLSTLPRFGSPTPREHPLFAPFVGALAAPLAITIGRHLEPRPLLPGLDRRWLLGGVIAFLAVPPLALLTVGTLHLPIDLVCAAAMVALALLIYAFLRGRGEPTADLPLDLRTQGLAAALSALMVTPLYLRWIGII